MFDAICLCCWRLARNKAIGHLDCRSLLEMFIKIAVFSSKRSLSSAAAAVCQEIIGRGLVGNGGRAADLIPDGTRQSHIPIMKHSEFGYQTILSGSISSQLASYTLTNFGHSHRLKQTFIDVVHYKAMTETQIDNLLDKCAELSTRICQYTLIGSLLGILHLITTVGAFLRAITPRCLWPCQELRRI